ncbi:ribosome-recycling factor [Exophiala xenobiotica]|uniref:Ribosome-recycling factor n=1 Tax=Vermiconidia calcicola TaxID=1690605 RepID=A0AAV9QJA0_9PEZI|nr:ribosome-recycling factor [Exophiala xenobiotica]KAK5529870.1 ribosome-recycling factor [Chaetothyriales sp. CCFEE 6169]KAK5542639.1 ribosome-recycling factor [Vermiconidia calcicola]KAK5211877.1 ribosome-recycling factor [Exophiala xenobiotica]KAK5226199.1 ribosome-recycling factor [Exophiala xenobiotica]
MSLRSRDAAQILHQFLSFSRSPATANVRPTTVCMQCRIRNPTLLRSPAPAVRQMSTTSPLLKKSSASSKSSRKSPDVTSTKNNRDGAHIPDNAATRNRDREIDPYDFTELNAGIAKAVARLKDALVKTRDAGRITPEMVESFPVELNVKGAAAHGSKPHHEQQRLGDIASVVQKGGRMVQVYCSEEAHVKPISSAIQASQHSLVPQHDASNPLLINIPVPPATAETRQQAKEEAKKVYDRASQDVRNARGDEQKRFRKMELGKMVVEDELRKAHKQMEDVVKKGQDECKKVYEAAVKALG